MDTSGQRFLRDLGVQEVEVVVLDIPKDKEQALNIALNKIAGRWDEQQLLAVLQQLKDADYDVSLTGFDEREIAALLRRAGADGVEDDGFDVDQAYTDATGAEIQRGGIWRLGEHRLMCGGRNERGRPRRADGRSRGRAVPN